MTPIGQLLVGPAEHGVVRFGRELLSGLRELDALGPVVTATWSGLAERPEAVLAPLAGCRLVHTQFTDRLFGPRCETAATLVGRVAAALDRHGAGLSVTLHDLPATDGSDGAPPALAVRRGAAYAEVVRTARGVVVCSRSERTRLAMIAPDVRAAVVPLPVTRPQPAPAVLPPVRDVTVLGFLYPGKGHDEVLRAMTGLPPELGFTALGRASDGHADLVPELTRLAATQRRNLRVTGFVADAELPTALRSAGIPVAPHRHVSASGSIATWWGAGRRPLVPDVPYTRELLDCWPGAVWLYDDDLKETLARAVARPEQTWLRGVPVGPELPVVAAAYLRTLSDWTLEPPDSSAAGADRAG